MGETASRREVILLACKNPLGRPVSVSPDGRVALLCCLLLHEEKCRNSATAAWKHSLLAYDTEEA